MQASRVAADTPRADA